MNLKKLAFPAKLVFSLCLLAYVYRKVDLQAFGNVLRQINPWMLIPINILLFTNTVISVIKWQMLLKADDVHVPLKTLLASYYIGFFFNVFLPSNIGGDSYRVYHLARSRSKAAEGFASVFAERFTGFLALIFNGFLFSLIGFRYLPNPRMLILPAALFSGMMLTVVVLFAKDFVLGMMRLFQVHRLPKLYRFGEQVLDSIQTYRNDRPLLAKTMAISFAFQFIAIAAIWLIGVTLRINAHFVHYCIFVPLIMILEVLPISIYGVGVRDAGYVYFFTQVGVWREQALSLSMLFVIMSLFYALAGGIVFLARKGTKAEEAG